MLICTLASGSDGNAVLIGHKGTYLLVDAGISAKRINKALWELGVSDIACVLVTHDHSDHIGGLAVLRKDVYAAPLTAQTVRNKAPYLHTQEINGDFAVGDIGITPFETPHDAPDSLGFLFDLDGFRVCVCTDLGHVTRSVMAHACKADYLLIESNHDEAMLQAGRYPSFLKKRILGPRGHLSNNACAEVVLAAVQNGTRAVTLCHLSKDNNRPELAERVSVQRLCENGVAVGKDVRLDVAPHGVLGVPFRL